jgi:undecaprenyl-diphosphatase
MELNREVLLAIGFSFITALITIAVLMSWLKRASFTPFAIYRIILGIALLIWVYGYDTAPLGTLF